MESVQRNRTQPWHSSGQRSYRSKPSRWPRVCTLKQSPSRSRPEWPGGLSIQLRIALWVRKEKRGSVVKRGGSLHEKTVDSKHTRLQRSSGGVGSSGQLCVPPPFVVFAVSHNRTSLHHSAGSLFLYEVLPIVWQQAWSDMCHTIKL
jgi:hypothetical protein